MKKQGAVLVRYRAKHDVYMQPKTNKEATVPRHDEINEYTAKAIIVGCGLGVLVYLW
jgi:predicted RNA binding protein YcfA (HicA-like mRNA interferase family)